jgi:hypothetical protein
MHLFVSHFINYGWRALGWPHQRNHGCKRNKSVIYHYSAEYRDSSGDNGSTRAMAGDGIFSTTVPPSDPNFMAKIREMIATSAVPPISSNKIVIRSLTPLGVGVIQHK